METQVVEKLPEPPEEVSQMIIVAILQNDKNSCMSIFFLCLSPTGFTSRRLEADAAKRAASLGQQGSL